MINISLVSPTGENTKIVKSVNGMTGEVILTAKDLDAATEDYVNKKVAEAAISGSDVDLSDYYTKSEVDTAIDNVEVDLTGYATENYVISKINEIELSPDRTGVYIGDEEPTDDFVNIWIDTLGEAQFIPAEGGNF